MIEIKHVDCIEDMKATEEGFYDFLITDPPYFINFMGLNFDKASTPLKIQRMHEWWLTEAFRVLKPGGVCYAFTAPRTKHRLAAAMDAVGFEVVDQEFLWIFCSGFPKSLDVSKAIDKLFGLEREIIGPDPAYNGEGKRTGIHAFKVSAEDNGQVYKAPPGMLTKPASPEAERWKGWGTGLKPAYEPVVIGRKR